jgi:putative endonuclease
MDRHDKGRRGEDIAKNYLIKQGFSILEHGFRCRNGEVDIVAEKGGELYFVEVKTRWSLNCGAPLEAIDRHKQRQVINAARFYLMRKKRNDAYCHLSAIGVDMSGREPVIEFIKDAFEA